MTSTSTPTTSPIPGPLSFPLIGGKVNFLRFLSSPFAFTKSMHAHYGDVVGIGRGDASYVFVLGPGWNHAVLSNASLYETSGGNFFKFKEDSALGRMFMNNLGVMQGELHKQQRKLQQPAFHRQQIAGYQADMVRLTAAMLDGWQPGATLDVHREMQRLTQRIAVKTLFGLEDESELSRVETLLDEVVTMTGSPLIFVLPYDVPGLPYHRLTRLVEELEGFIRRIIARKHEEPHATDVLASLVHARDEDGTMLTDDQLVGHAFTLFVAGHETTANALSWLFFLLSQNPAAASALHTELNDVLRGIPPTVEQLGHLPYLEGVVKETLRLMPPAPVGLRMATESTTLGTYAIPKGATVFYNEMMTHRMPALYSDPYRFQPDRWATLNRTIYEYLPFAAGIHMCIGAGFAMMELKVVAAMVWQHYQLTMAPNRKISVNIRMRPLGGLPMTVQPQTGVIEPVPVSGNIHELVDLGE